MSEHYYLLSPEMRTFETRHAAVGAAAVFERGSVHLEARVVDVERGTRTDDAAQAMLDGGTTMFGRDLPV